MAKEWMRAQRQLACSRRPTAWNWCYMQHVFSPKFGQVSKGLHCPLAVRMGSGSLGCRSCEHTSVFCLTNAMCLAMSCYALARAATASRLASLVQLSLETLSLIGLNLRLLNFSVLFETVPGVLACHSFRIRKVVSTEPAFFGLYCLSLRRGGRPWLSRLPYIFTIASMFLNQGWRSCFCDVPPASPRSTTASDTPFPTYDKAGSE